MPFIVPFAFSSVSLKDRMVTWNRRFIRCIRGTPCSWRTNLQQKRIDLVAEFLTKVWMNLYFLAHSLTCCCLALSRIYEWFRFFRLSGTAKPSLNDAIKKKDTTVTYAGVNNDLLKRYDTVIVIARVDRKVRKVKQSSKILLDFFQEFWDMIVWGGGVWKNTGYQGSSLTACTSASSAVSVVCGRTTVRELSKTRCTILSPYCCYKAIYRNP